MNCFMHALENNDKRIYVIGTFEKNGCIKTILTWLRCVTIKLV